MRAFNRPGFIPIAEAAVRLGCSVRTLQRIAREGRVSFLRRGRFAFILREDLFRLEVDGRTDWLVARLSGPEADSMRVAEWFRHWIEMQRIAAPAAVDADRESSFAAADHVIEQDGDRSMAEYRVADLAETLQSLASPVDQAVGLRVLASWPGSPRLVDAYREAARVLVGWQDSLNLHNSRKRRGRADRKGGEGFDRLNSPPI